MLTAASKHTTYVHVHVSLCHRLSLKAGMLIRQRAVMFLAIMFESISEVTFVDPHLQSSL
jgi:hypothetical protein